MSELSDLSTTLLRATAYAGGQDDESGADSYLPPVGKAIIGINILI
jgi:hypothetical protein